MSLNLNQLSQQIDQMSQALAARAGSRRDRIALACERLRAYSEEFEMLLAKVHRTRTRGRAQELGWVGAFPPEDEAHREPLALGYPLPACPPAATLIANDGSQIPPDRHGVMLYFLVNVGSIVLHPGSGAAPVCEITQELYYEDDALFPEGELVSGGAVNARRDLLAIQELARLAERHAQPPALAIVDGPLLLWGYQETLPGAQRRREENIRTYLDALARLRAARAFPAGYIDRPWNRGVVNLLYLGSLDEEQITPESLRQSDLLGVRDQDVFRGHLKPGERSALFVTQSHINKTYAQRGHEIWFFYLNVESAAPEGSNGGEERHTLARVEVPAWVAQDRTALDAVHALLYGQCQVLGGRRYPYVLARADELARVDPGDKLEVERLIQRVLMQQGEPAQPSEKEQAKRLTRRGPRRRR